MDSLAAQRELRERWGVGVLTRLRPDMKLVAPFESGPVAVCPQGQRLAWLGYEARALLRRPPPTSPLGERLPEQLPLDLPEEK